MCGFQHKSFNEAAAPHRLQLFIIEVLQEFQQLAKPHIAKPIPGPCRKGGIALLRAGTTVIPIVDVEDAFMRHAPAHIIEIAALAVVNE